MTTKFKLLGATAAAALLSVSFAAAQTPPKEEQGKSLEQQQKGAIGGALKTQGSQTAPSAKTPGQPGAERAQGAKPEPEERERMGQGRPEEGKPPQRGAQEERQRGAQEERTLGQSTEKSHGPPAGAASVQLSQDQRSRITGVIGRGHGPRVANVNFSVSVGAAVPRDVHVEVLPAAIVEIVPEYRGFDYVVVGDQILIIDPNSMEIVAIIPA
jgi:hypothetical protein